MSIAGALFALLGAAVSAAHGQAPVGPHNKTPGGQDPCWPAGDRKFGGGLQPKRSPQLTAWAKEQG